MKHTPHQTTLRDDETYGLGEITLQHPPETSPITPATRISIEAIGVHKHLLHGIGIDWGCGGGCLSIAASRIPEVNRIIGFDISEDRCGDSHRERAVEQGRIENQIHAI